MIWHDVTRYDLTLTLHGMAWQDSVAKNERISREKEESDAKEYDLNRKKARAEGGLKKVLYVVYSILYIYIYRPSLTSNLILHDNGVYSKRESKGCNPGMVH